MKQSQKAKQRKLELLELLTKNRGLNAIEHLANTIMKLEEKAYRLGHSDGIATAITHSITRGSL
jgi:hypothetical protein